MNSPATLDYLKVVRLRLSRARRSKGLTQEAAAEAANLPLRTYQGLESIGDKRPFNPTLTTLMAIAQAVSLTLPELLREPSDEELSYLDKHPASTSNAPSNSASLKAL
jgi:transcriptional regulator with XRE-family HTH domain